MMSCRHWLGWLAGGVLVLAMAGCGTGKPPFVSSVMTVVIGAGGKADEPQNVVKGIGGISVGDEVLLGDTPCSASGDKWLLKQTVTLQREVKAGTKATLALEGAQGTEEIEITFSDSMIPRKKKYELWGTTLEVQCYASVGNKWGLLVFVQPR